MLCVVCGLFLLLLAHTTLHTHTSHRPTQILSAASLSFPRGQHSTGLLLPIPITPVVVDGCCFYLFFGDDDYFFLSFLMALHILLCHQTVCLIASITSPSVLYFAHWILLSKKICVPLAFGRQHLYLYYLFMILFLIESVLSLDSLFLPLSLSLRSIHEMMMMMMMLHPYIPDLYRMFNSLTDNKINIWSAIIMCLTLRKRGVMCYFFLLDFLMKFFVHRFVLYHFLLLRSALESHSPYHFRMYAQRMCADYPCPGTP